MTSKICIIAVGKLPSEHKSICEHYLKMLGKSVVIQEIITKKNLPHLEEKAILEKISTNQNIVLLDVKGKQCDSYQFAKMLENSDKEICFIIGGASGVTEEIKKAAKISISLSNLTFPHMLARIILLEQIYRAKSIISNHPYHKD